jgi:hypothetical protein
MTLAVIMLCAGAVAAADEHSLRADRAAIERVYYTHRIGQKPPFERVLPPEVLDALVRLDLRKEAILAQVYGVRITPSMLQAEVDRIDATTRAPEMLADIRLALGNDAARFANAFAKPFLVERLLRERFDNDDALHAPQRQEAERTRSDLLAARSAGADGRALVAILKRGHASAVTETTWRLGSRTTQSPPADDELEVRQRFGPSAKTLSAAGARSGEDPHFEDLPTELRTVLGAQLRQAGDISAVIETPTGFLLHVAREKTEQVLSAAVLWLAKRSYEQWVDEQAVR